MSPRRSSKGARGRMERGGGEVGEKRRKCARQWRARSSKGKGGEGKKRKRKRHRFLSRLRRRDPAAPPRTPARKERGEASRAERVHAEAHVPAPRHLCAWPFVYPLPVLAPLQVAGHPRRSSSRRAILYPLCLKPLLIWRALCTLGRA